MNRNGLIWLTVLSVFILTVGCAAAAVDVPVSVSPKSTAVSASDPSPEPTPAPETSSQAPEFAAPSSEPPVSSRPAQSAPSQTLEPAVYRGTIQGIVSDKSGLHLTLSQAEGTDFGAPFITALVLPSTNVDCPVDHLKEGVYLEIHYKRPLDFDFSYEVAVDSALNLRLAEMRNYNGELLELVPDDGRPGTGTLLMKDFNSDFTFLFFYNENTLFGLDPASLKAGDRLNIFRAAAATMTNPPQSAAIEIRPYAVPQS